MSSRSIKSNLSLSYVHEALDRLKTRKSVEYTSKTAFFGIEHTKRVKAALLKLPTTNLEHASYSPTVHLLNCISAAYYAHVFGRGQHWPAIIFGSKSSSAPLGDYLALLIQPDYYAYLGTIDELKRICNKEAEPSPRPWSEMLQVGEHKRSKGTRRADGQMISYLATLKRYRVDLLTVHAFSVEKGMIKLASLNPCGMATSPAVTCSDLNAWIAHVALVYRAHEERDLEMQYCSVQSDFHRWDIRADGQDGLAVVPFYVSSPPGRMTFACFEVLPLPEGDDMTDPEPLSAMDEEFSKGDVRGFWKTSWQRVSARATEIGLLSDLHKNGWVPGLVRPYGMRPPLPDNNQATAEAAEALSADLPTPAPPSPSTARHILRHPSKPEDVGRVREILHLGSIGEPLSQCKTTRQLVEAMYDLIEVHAHLAELGVLHRDVSWYNVMCNPQHFIKTHPHLQTDKELPRPCISSILGRPDPKPSILLADLDHSVKITEHSPHRSEKTGTPMFISVEQSKPASIEFKNQPLAKLKDILGRAERHIDAFDKAFLNGVDGTFMSDFDRVMQAEATRIELSTEFKSNAPPPPITRHDLRHDAESIYWVFLWAFARAQPRLLSSVEDETDELNCLSAAMFEHSIGGPKGEAARAKFLMEPSLSNLFHPTLSKMRHLFAWMSSYLAIPWYLYCGDEATTRLVKSDHVHIAFRRFILVFLLDPENSDVLEVELDTTTPRYTSSLENLCREEPVNTSKRNTTGVSGTGTDSKAWKASASHPVTTAGTQRSTGSNKRTATAAGLPTNGRMPSSALATQGDDISSGSELDSEEEDQEEQVADVPVEEVVAQPAEPPIPEDEALLPAGFTKSSAYYRRLVFWKDRTLWFGSGIKPVGARPADADEDDM